MSYLLANSECMMIVYSDSYTDVIEELKTDNLPIKQYINVKFMSDYIQKGTKLIANGNKDFISK